MRSAAIFNNFTAGELSPKLGARVDLSKYDNGLKTCQNCIIQPQGGACRRTGFEYIAEVKNSASPVRLVPFIFSETQAYILEFGDQYIRVFMDGAQVMNAGSPVELATPYLEAELSLLKHAQSADTLYIVHPDHETAKLTRTSHIAWTLTDVNFNPPPTSMQDFEPAATLHPGAVTGNGITFDTDANVFLTGDADRQIVAGSARAIITTVNGVSQVTADIIDDFPNLDPISAGDWALRGSPTGSVKPNKKLPLGAIVRLDSSLNSFRAADVGKYISLNDGFVKITQYTSGTRVYGELLKELTTKKSTTAWTLEKDDWSVANGFPRAVTFFDGRIWYGGSASFSANLWGSVADDYENFTAGVDDADSINTTLVSGQVDVIQWIVGTKKLIIGTNGAEWWMSGGKGSEELITPSNKLARCETTFGSEDRMPININNCIIFIQKPGKNLREFKYDFGPDSYGGKDLNTLAEHLTWSHGITELAYQQSPNKIIWGKRADGVLLGLTYMPEHEVIGWHEHPTDGEVESIAAIPGDVETELWAQVKRTVDGSTERYIERLKTTDWLYAYNQTETVPVSFVTETWGERDGTGPLGITDDHSGERDARICEQSPNAPSGGSIYCGQAFGFNIRNMMKFSLRDIIPDAYILTATLKMYRHYMTGAHNVSLYRCLQYWAKDEVTWNSRITGQTWNTAGCANANDGEDDDGTADRKATAEDTVAVPVFDGYLDFDIKDLVQKWVDGTAAEYGIHIKSDNEAGWDQNCQFWDDDCPSYGYKPYLEIKYRMPGTTSVVEHTNEDEAFYVDSGLTYRQRADITAANAVSPVLITAANSVTNDDQVFIHRVEGMTELNDNTYIVANVTSAAFELKDVDGRGYHTYESGGYADKLATIITGLDHLEGESVAIIADGEAQAEQVVSSGQITLSAGAHEVHAGLPYTPIFETMRIESGSDDGTAQAKIKRFHELSIRILGTKNIRVGPNADTLENLETTLLATDEDVELAFPGGYNKEGRVYITQNDPYPMTILGLMPRLNTNDG